MKKTLFILMISIAFLATGCKKDKSKTLNYNDSNPISLVLQGHHQIQASSDYNITYSAINEGNKEVITVTGAGNIYGKNVGAAKVKLDNGHESKIVDVKVDLFKEPTFDFGCGSSKIRELFGAPYQSAYINDTTLVYQYTANQGYSYACGEMDFFFNRGAYFEADVYIRKNCKYLLESIYLNNNFTLDEIKCDSTTLANYGDTVFIYRNKLDDNIVCGKFASHNQWEEICLFYFRDNNEKSVANILKRRPRSSKFLY